MQPPMLHTTENLPPAEPLPSPWATTFYSLVGECTGEILIASPFLGTAPITKLGEVLAGGRRGTVPSLHIVTDLSVDSLLSGSLDVGALALLAQRCRGSRVTYLPSLHAKVYVFDSRIAVVTSGNLTEGGLVRNYEYGVLLRDPGIVDKIRADLLRYATLGSDVSVDALIDVTEAIGGVVVARQQVDRSVSARVRALLQQRTQEARTAVLRARATGKTTHGIFSETILYLLDEKGPLSTTQMHPLVKQLQPDLCDDDMDCVISGVHFGKQWKHYVRNAQQALKRQGLITLEQGRWRRTS